MQITPAMLEAVAGRPLPNDVDRPLAEAMSKHLPTEGIVTALRVCHFIAQAAHETGGFSRFVERGNGDRDGDGLDDYFVRYDRRADLGNTPALDGDGELYKGRGIFQLTGRANYRTFGAKLGLDLLRKPQIAAEPEPAVRIACAYWTSRRINFLADKDDLVGVTKAINGGTTGLADRAECLRRIKAHLKL